VTPHACLAASHLVALALNPAGSRSMHRPQQASRHQRAQTGRSCAAVRLDLVARSAGAALWARPPQVSHESGTPGGRAARRGERERGIGQQDGVSCLKPQSLRQGESLWMCIWLGGKKCRRCPVGHGLNRWPHGEHAGCVCVGGGGGAGLPGKSKGPKYPTGPKKEEPLTWVLRQALL
jgi:hypothetical protein